MHARTIINMLLLFHRNSYLFFSFLFLPFFFFWIGRCLWILLQYFLLMNSRSLARYFCIHINPNHQAIYGALGASLQNFWQEFRFFLGRMLSINWIWWLRCWGHRLLKPLPGSVSCDKFVIIRYIHLLVSFSLHYWMPCHCPSSYSVGAEFFIQWNRSGMRRPGDTWAACGRRSQFLSPKNSQM